MPKTLLLTCSLIACNMGFAQTGDTLLRYLDADLHFTSAKKSSYYAKAYPVATGYRMDSYTKDGRLLSTGTYLNNKLAVKQGRYVLYYTDGMKRAEGSYINSKAEGAWRWWYPNGQLKDSGTLAGDELDGIWQSWHPNGQPRVKAAYQTIVSVGVDGNQVRKSVHNGAYTSWYEDGTKESEGNFSSGLMTGTWKWYHPNGQPSTIEIYNKDGKVAGMTCFDTTGKQTGDFCSLDRPAYLKDKGNFREYVSKAFQWPARLSGQKAKGTVWVSFTVSKEGKMERLQVKGTTIELANAVHAFIKELPGWEPAISHNRPIAWEEQVEISYRRNTLPFYGSPEIPFPTGDDY